MSFVDKIVAYMLASYNISNGAGKDGRASGKTKLNLTDDEVTRAMVSTTNDEKRFLKLHAKILKMAASERMKSRVMVMYTLYTKLPLWMRIMLPIWAFGAFIVLLPVAFKIVYGVAVSPIGRVKIIVLVGFCVAILLFCIAIGMPVW